MATTRLDYRDPKQPRAVCVYTIAQESKYIRIENVPSLGLVDELMKRCSVYGKVQQYELLDKKDYHEVYLIHYDTIQSARLAKRRMDDKPFYSQLLRVSYAPEYETVQDIRDKFQDRVQSILGRLQTNHEKHATVTDTSSKKRKRI